MTESLETIRRPRSKAPAPTRNRAVSRKPSDERWAQLLQISTELFAAQGYAATSLQDIAEASGVLKGSLYYYIKTKEDLLFEIIRDVCDLGLRNLLRAVSDESRPSIERLNEAIAAHLRLTVAKKREVMVFLNEFDRLSPERQEQIPTRELEHVFENLIRTAQAEGDIRSDLDPVIANMTILGAVGWLYRWIDAFETLSDDQIVEQITELLMQGVRS